MKVVQTVKATGEEVLFKEKKSKFIGYVFPVDEVAEVETALQKLHELHPKATHICYAYRLDDEGAEWRAHDDGEPAGSAGQPILGQLVSFGLTHVLLAVVRYYGGTKLGVGGLKQAYKATAQNTLEQAEKVEKILMQTASVKCAYSKLGQLQHFIENNCGNVLTIEQQQEALVTFEVPHEESGGIFLEIRERFSLTPALINPRP